MRAPALGEAASGRPAHVDTQRWTAPPPRPRWAPRTEAKAPLGSITCSGPTVEAGQQQHGDQRQARAENSRRADDWCGVDHHHGQKSHVLSRPPIQKSGHNTPHGSNNVPEYISFYLAGWPKSGRDRAHFRQNRPQFGRDRHEQIRRSRTRSRGVSTGVGFVWEAPIYRNRLPWKFRRRRLRGPKTGPGCSSDAKSQSDPR